MSGRERKRAELAPTVGTCPAPLPVDRRPRQTREKGHSYPPVPKTKRGSMQTALKILGGSVGLVVVFAGLFVV
jgi:hypothetical protein